MKKLVVVTGGAGFIGSHTVDYLLKNKYQVIVLDDFSTGRRENLEHHSGNPDLEVYEVNIVTRLWSKLSAILNDRPVHSIIHLAAQTAVVQSVADPIQDVKVNYSTTIEVLEFAKINNIKSVFFASSAAVYGDCSDELISEKAQCQPLSPYGINKLGSEMYMEYYKKVHNINATSFRFFNVFGPRQDPMSSYSGVISIFFDRALKNKDLVIFGDGQQTRDFVYVEDVVQNILFFLNENMSSVGAYNVGTSTKTTITELAEFIIEMTGSKSKIIHKESRPGEIIHSQASIEKLKKINKTFPNYALENGLQITTDWFREATI